MADVVARTAPKKVKSKSKWLKRLKVISLLAFVPLTIGTIGATIYAQKQLNDAAKLIPNLPEVMKIVASERTVIKSQDGKILESIATEFRRPIRIQDAPNKIIKATLAAEDKRFYQHSGVDFYGMGRAVFSTVSGKRVEGGSTITMQIAKRVYTGNSKTMDRKIKDMALATMIERQLSKEQILELYLNQVFYGSGAYGISAAAEVYFGKKLDDLTWSEAATLARCVRRPSDENPFTNLKVAVRNRNAVLGIIKDEGWMTEDEYSKALAEPLKLKKARAEVSTERFAPYFCDYVKAWIKDNLPDIDLTKGGYTIETTLDTNLQKYAEKQVSNMVRRNKGLRITTAAFVLLDNEGRVLSMVGGPNYNKNQFNVITQGRRQPGSSFKPLVYATAFEYGALSPDGYVRNDPYMIHDDAGHRRAIKGGGKGGEVSVRSAIAQSINTPAMWALDKVGLNNVINMAHGAFGIKTDLPAVESIALGADEVTPMEMATAYSVFQNKGDRFTPFGVARVIGPDGIPIKIVNPEFSRRMLSPSAAEGIDMCLRAVVTSGTGRGAGSVTNARGKTGTTTSNKDAWFCGYTDKFVGVGWVANEVRTESGRTTYKAMDSYVMGGHMVAPLWADIVGYAQDVVGEESRHIRGYADSGSKEEKTDEIPTEEPDQGLGNQDAAPDSDPAMNSEDAPSEKPDEGADPPLKEGTKKPANIPKSENSEKRTDQNERIVFVEICADSGQRANIACPERVRRAFKLGSEPKGRCKIHRG